MSIMLNYRNIKLYNFINSLQIKISDMMDHKDLINKRLLKINMTKT